MPKHQPKHQALKLNKDWVLSGSKCVYLIHLDNTICGYCKTKEEAEALISSLGSDIESELRAEKEKTAKVWSETVSLEGDPIKITIYDISFGYVYNSSPKIRHTLTYSIVYNCYGVEEESQGLSDFEEIEPETNSISFEEDIEQKIRQFMMKVFELNF